MLSKVTDAVMGEVTYSYNGFGKRVAVVNPEEKIEYLLDLTKDYHNMLERNVNGETEVYTYDSNVVSMSKAGNDYFYMLDELGTGMYLTGTDGIATSIYAYDEFGRNINPFTGQKEKPAYTKKGNIIQPLAFTGYQHDEITGSYFAQARYYDSNAGRFVSRDKDRYIWFAKSESLNLYEYCFNKPNTFIDPTGHYTKPDYLIEGVEAHIFMEAYAMTRFGANCSVEHPIEGGSYHGSGTYGYADIVMFNDVTAEIYEIKPGSYSTGGVNHAAGIAQLNGYVSAFNNPAYTNTNRRGSVVATTGTSYDSVFSVAMKSTFKPGYYIVYRTYGDGLIIYDYQKSIPDGCREVQPELNAIQKSLQYYLHVSDETMETIKTGALVGGILILAILIGVLAADDIFTLGAGAVDDGAIVPLATMLLNFIKMLFSSGTPCFG